MQAVTTKAWDCIITVQNRSASDASMTLWLGFFADTTPALNENGIGFHVVNGTIYSYTGDGVNYTQTNCGSLPGRYGSMLFDIRWCTEAADTVKFYINGVLKATHTTNLSDNVSMYFVAQLTNQAAATKYIRLRDYVLVGTIT